ncbi:MAG: hypothetical protein E7480_04360 [Ruminococcaceae bacterium]|nr:hypothetical protein [Oscillospiraceae bacterium]
MKIYAEKDIETDSVEILLNYQELKTLASALTKFEDEVKRFKIENEDKKELGFTHLHFKDCGLIGKNSNSDIVFYVDLNEKID